MLFQQLYNWIKYKTLPPSILSKNRLYIERDSKHRRIFTNFGLIFRNMKWSNYSKFGVKFNLRSSYTKYLMSFIIPLLIIYISLYLNQLYSTSLYLNIIAYPFWFTLDSLDYYSSFFLYFLWVAILTIQNYLFSMVFPYSDKNVNYKVVISFLEKRYLNIPKIFGHTNPSNLSRSKPDLKWLLYVWLSKGKSPNKSIYIENLFDSNLNKNWWSENYIFFHKLFDVVSTLQGATNNNNFSKLKDLKQDINSAAYDNIKMNPFLVYSINFNNPNLLTTLIDYLICHKKSNFEETSSKTNPALAPLGYLNAWELMGFNLESDKYSYILNIKTNSFYFNGLNFGDLNNLLTNVVEAQVIGNTLNNQLNIINQNRWLYRYSILHRKTFKMLNKYTQIKSLIIPQLDNNFNISQNLWFSKNLQNNFNNIVTKSPYINFNFLNFKFSNQNPSSINFYENSFLWFLKRNYMFNSSSNLFYKTIIDFEDTTNQNSLDGLIMEDYSNKYKSIVSFMLASQYFTNNNLQTPLFKINSSYTNNLDCVESGANSYNFYDLNDAYLYNNESDILDLNSLKVLNWLSNANAYQSVNFFNFFREVEMEFEADIYGEFSLEESNVGTLFMKYVTGETDDEDRTASHQKELNYFFFKSLLDFDNLYLSDIKLLLKI